MAAGAALLAAPGTPRAEHLDSCVVDRVIDGDTFICGDGTRVRLLQINAPEATAPGGPWATDVLRFFVGGREVGLEYDEVALDRFGRHLAAPVVTGTDGNDYNISILMVFVGMARSAYYGDNSRYLELARAAEAYARAACWNMWGAGNPWAEESGCA